MADTIEQAPTEQQEAPAEKSIKYADDGAEGLENFLSDKVGKDYMEKVSERKQQPQEEEPEPEEQKSPEKSEVSEKVEKLLAKSESEGLSEEEIAFMKEQGYEVEEEQTQEQPKEEEEKEEEEVKFTLPEDFTSELDDFFSDDENYDPEKLTVEDRLNYASRAIKIMRGNQSKLQQVFDSSPEVAGFVADIVKGIDPAKAIKNNMPELLEVESAPDPTKDKEAYDQWVIDQHNAKQERKRIQELQKKQQENLQKSVQDAQLFVQEKKITDPKQHQKFFNELDRHLADVAKHHITKEFMDLVYKGMNYENDISSAERSGEVKGMNRKIKLTKRNGDGLARIRAARKEPKRGVQYKDETTESFAKFIGD